MLKVNAVISCALQPIYHNFPTTI